MPRLVDYVRRPDGRAVGIRCASCGTVWINQPGNIQAHADHTWECPERTEKP